jgi:hypothetical protein
MLAALQQGLSVPLHLNGQDFGVGTTGRERFGIIREAVIFLHASSCEVV